MCGYLNPLPERKLLNPAERYENWKRQNELDTHHPSSNIALFRKEGTMKETISVGLIAGATAVPAGGDIDLITPIPNFRGSSHGSR